MAIPRHAEMDQDAINHEYVSKHPIVVLHMESFPETDLGDLREFQLPHTIQLTQHLVAIRRAFLITVFHQVQGESSNHAVPNRLKGCRLVKQVQYNLVSHGNGNAVGI